MTELLVTIYVHEIVSTNYINDFPDFFFLNKNDFPDCIIVWIYCTRNIVGILEIIRMRIPP